MVKTTLDLGRARYAHIELACLLSCSASASIQSEHHIVRSDLSFSECFSNLHDVWFRSDSPLSLNLFFSFDDLAAWTLIDNSHLMHCITAAVASKSLWGPFNLVVSNAHTSKDESFASSCSFSIALSLETSPLVVHQKSKRWRRYVERPPNDLNLPPGISSVRLSAINVQLLLTRSDARDVRESDGCGQENFIHGCVELVESSMKSLLSSSARIAKDVSKAQPFEQPLEQAFPSLFCPAYSQAVAKRSILAPSISRSLDAFYSRFESAEATPITLADSGTAKYSISSEQSNACTSQNINPKIEIQLWRLMMDQDIPSRRLTKRSTDRGHLEAQTFCSGPAGALQTSILHANRAQGINAMTDPGDVDMYESLLEQSADPSRNLDLEIRQTEEVYREANTHASARFGRTSFEELGEIQVPSSCNNDECPVSQDTKASSSQNTVVASDDQGSKEESWDYQEYNQNTDLGVWDHIIGPCDELTQISGRGDPPCDSLLRSMLSPSCDEVFLEDLHISTSFLENVSNAAAHAVVDSDFILCDSAHYGPDLVPKRTCPSIDKFIEGDNHRLLASSLRKSSPSAVEMTVSSCGDLFELEGCSMQSNETEIRAWRSRLSSPDMLVGRADEQAGGILREETTRPQPGKTHQPSFSYSFVKRSSTASTQSSSTSGSPQRRRSILQKWSRRYSAKSKVYDSEMSDLEFGMFGGRDVEVKRRKTLEDYEANAHGDDEEMLFV